MFDLDVNYWAVLVAAVVNMVIGMIWYSKSAFGKAWMEAAGKTDADIKKGGMGKAYFFMIVASLVLAFVLAHFVQFVGAATIGGGIQLAFWIWLGFVVTISIGDYLWEERSLKLYWINNSYRLVSLIVMGAILAAWA